MYYKNTNEWAWSSNYLCLHVLLLTLGCFVLKCLDDWSSDNWHFNVLLFYAGCTQLVRVGKKKEICIDWVVIQCVTSLLCYKAIRRVCVCVCDHAIKVCVCNVSGKHVLCNLPSHVLENESINTCTHTRVSHRIIHCVYFATPIFKLIQLWCTCLYESVYFTVISVWSDSWLHFLTDVLY